jgi:uncharacterized membrane protein
MYMVNYYEHFITYSTTTVLALALLAVLITPLVVVLVAVLVVVLVVVRGHGSNVEHLDFWLKCERVTFSLR